MRKLQWGLVAGTFVIRVAFLLGLLFPLLSIAVTPMAAAGTSHTVALKADGTVVAWGNNVSGQLGDGTNTNRSSPVAVPGLTGVVAVAAGWVHTVALKADGTVVEWGYNYYGQLGDGSNTNRSSPVAVPGLTGVVAVAAGYGHTVALKADGTVVAWGNNVSGQLGDGTNTTRSSPVAVPGLTGVVAVAAGYQHTVALKADGTVVAWGYNGDGELGDGTNTNRSSPVAVPGLTGVVAVAAGDQHTVALKADGTVVAWGYNYYGQLGDGTSTSRSSPVAVPGFTGVVAVAAGYVHTVALKADGTVVAWGGNYNGQLGDGTSTNRSSPVAVTGLHLGLIGLTASPTSLTFATQNLGTSSAAQTVTLSNTGSSVLNIALIRVSGDYSRTTTCGTTLTAGASCSVSVSFSPTPASTHSGGLAVVNNGVILCFVQLNGSSIGATTLGFGRQNLGSTSAAQTVTLNNASNVVLNIASISASSNYGVSHDCGAGLGAGGSCTLSITFSPTVTGNRSGTITLIDSAFDSPQTITTITLSGTGQGGLGSLSTTALSFGSQNQGSSSSAQSVTLTNIGGAILNITGIATSGDFVQSNNCGATLAQAASCSISVRFLPHAVGTRSGNVVISSDAPSSPDTISLSGNGVAAPVVSLSATALIFATQDIGTTSAAQTITLSNSGASGLSLASIAASGDFHQTNNCGSGLGIGGFCGISVSFSPTAAGTRAGAITIISNAAGSPHSVSLSGIATSTATFPNNRNNYSITKTSTGFTVTDKVGAGGAVALTGVTQIKFADMTVNLLIGDLSKTIPADSLKSLMELYVAFFNRIPDSDGLSYWIGQSNSGMSLDQIAESFYVAGIQYSSLTGFSSGMTPEDFINTVYRNVLGRPDGADQGGMDYWKPKLLDGSATHGSLVTDILYSAHTYKGDPTWGWVADLLDNKYSVASFFCLQQGLNYNTPEISIAEDMAIAAAVTPTSTAAAIALIMVDDSGFDLTGP